MNAVPGATGTKTRRDGRIAARPTRRTARRDLMIFLALVVGLSAPFELAIARTQALQDAGGVLLVGPFRRRRALDRSRRAHPGRGLHLPGPRRRTHGGARPAARGHRG